MCYNYSSSVLFFTLECVTIVASAKFLLSEKIKTDYIHYNGQTALICLGVVQETKSCIIATSVLRFSTKTVYCCQGSPPNLHKTKNILLCQYFVHSFFTQKSSRVFFKPSGCLMWRQYENISARNSVKKKQNRIAKRELER